MIRLQNLTKDYGSVRAVDHVNFEINEGEILGFLGPNGAGKSTLLKILSRVTRPTRGNFKVRGRIASLLEAGGGYGVSSGADRAREHLCQRLQVRKLVACSVP